MPEGQDPAKRIGDRFEVERALDAAGQARARTSDANSFLYMVRANQLALREYPSLEAALSRSQARWLVVPSPTDRVFLREGVEEMVGILRRAGRPVEVAELSGERGHLNGVLNVAPIGERVRAFLAN